MPRTCLRSSSKNLLVAVVTIFIIACFPAYVPAQSLDEAVADQLRTITNAPCRELRTNASGGLDLGNNFTGGLNSICTRTTFGGGSPQASSSGGGAGTPTALPSVVERRLEKVRGDEENKEESPNNPAEPTWHFGRWSAFISGEYESLDRNITTFEDGYDSDIRRFTVGADVQLSWRSLVGIALVTSDQDGDYDAGGNFDVNSFGAIIFGSIAPNDSMFIQASASYISRSTDRERLATFSSPDDPGSPTYTGSPDADFDAREFGLGIVAGYDIAINNFTMGPRVGLDWKNTKYDEYSEADSSGLALTFYEDDVRSVQSTVGIHASAAFSTSFGVVSPQAGLVWRHEFENDQRDVEVSFVDDIRRKKFSYQTEKLDPDFFEMNVGVVFVLPHGFQLFGNYQTLLGHSFYNSHKETLGLRKEF